MRPGVSARHKLNIGSVVIFCNKRIPHLRAEVQKLHDHGLQQSASDAVAPRLPNHLQLVNNRQPYVVLPALQNRLRYQHRRLLVPWCSSYSAASIINAGYRVQGEGRSGRTYVQTYSAGWVENWGEGDKPSCDSTHKSAESTIASNACTFSCTAD
jgi:hypothetical protein